MNDNHDDAFHSLMLGKIGHGESINPADAFRWAEVMPRIVARVQMAEHRARERWLTADVVRLKALLNNRTLALNRLRRIHKLGLDHPITSLGLPRGALNALERFCAQHEQPSTVGTIVQLSESDLLGWALGFGRKHLKCLNEVLAARGNALAGRNRLPKRHGQVSDNRDWRPRVWPKV